LVTLLDALFNGLVEHLVCDRPRHSPERLMKGSEVGHKDRR